MKKIDKANRPQPSKQLQLQRETIRRLETPELTRVRAGATQSWPTFTKPDI
jgi:hypothetical protein